ncbi:hypothetical protein GCM10010249_36280 [Streptomyces roseolilacinus]|uniref:Uncharacterized protein n=1 Tax=Streptomyces roseolilacinus TaxID=66904 RepID=A0A918B4Z3_9ACTN|nr:hypothetical protein GCM10010249_36280 [Streptomyces roseolilacinus]
MKGREAAGAMADSRGRRCVLGGGPPAPSGALLSVTGGVGAPEAPRVRVAPSGRKGGRASTVPPAAVTGEA